jgi:hypothetical protein
VAFIYLTLPDNIQIRCNINAIQTYTANGTIGSTLTFNGYVAPIEVQEAPATIDLYLQIYTLFAGVPDGT